MIPLTALTSWLLLAALCALGVTFAVLLARHLEAVDDRRSMTEWQRTREALEPLRIITHTPQELEEALIRWARKNGGLRIPGEEPKDGDDD
jgi:hypothetical protein